MRAAKNEKEKETEMEKKSARAASIGISERPPQTIREISFISLDAIIKIR